MILNTLKNQILGICRFLQVNDRIHLFKMKKEYSCYLNSFQTKKGYFHILKEDDQYILSNSSNKIFQLQYNPRLLPSAYGAFSIIIVSSYNRAYIIPLPAKSVPPVLKNILINSSKVQNTFSKIIYF